MKTLFSNTAVVLLAVLLLSACGNSGKEKKEILSGAEKILVDETFEPIIEDQTNVFQHSYGQAQIELVSRPEAEAVKLLLEDSARIIILPRELNEKEKTVFAQKKINPRITRFATDAIALVRHDSYPDSLVEVDDLIQLMQGKPGKLKSLVFDSPGSSTVRYFRELAGVAQLPDSGVYALASNAAVIRYVHDNPGTIGVVGVNWLEQPDVELEPYVAHLKTLAVKSTKPGDETYYKPTQSNLGLGVYPLTRGLYIINCQGGPGLGMGFASFLAGEDGQRIILKSGLLPETVPPREIIISNTIK